MATADHHPSRSNGTIGDGASFEVRWPALLNRWTDTLGLCNGGTHLRIDFIVRVRVAGLRASVDALVQWSGGRHDVVRDRHFDCVLAGHSAMTHLDIVNAERRVLALTLDRNARLLYAQTSLFQPAGLCSAAFDPPQLAHCRLQRHERRPSVGAST